MTEDSTVLGIGHSGGAPLDGASKFDGLMGMSVQDILREGQRALFARLVSSVRSGEASHQEMAILRNILRDNGLTLGTPPESPKEDGPAMDLPKYREPEFS